MKIPESMKQARRWVCWAGKKVPINPQKLTGADVSNAATWGDFSQALSAIGKKCTVGKAQDTVCGIGFVLGGGWVGIDLDGGEAHGGGTVPEDVLNDFQRLGTYGEISKSGAGYHFIGKYDGNPLKGSSKGCVEIYTGGRYFIVTGKALEPVQEVNDITATLPALHQKYIAPPPRNPTRSAGRETGTFLRDNLKGILEAIPASCGYDEWYKVGAALKQEGFDFSVFDEWSRTCPEKYHEQDTRKKWDSFRRESGADGGYLVNLAKQNGWQKPERPSFNQRQQKMAGSENPFEKAYANTGLYLCENGCVTMAREEKNGEIHTTPIANFAPLIVEEISRDNGAETVKEFLLEAVGAGGYRFCRIRIPAASFSAMGWAVGNWGARANLAPGTAKKDQLRNAIQAASRPNYRTIYSHTGWRKVAGRWCYLYNGGAVGAEGLEVELEGNLSAYTLDAPASSPQASADFLKLGALRVTAPLLCTMYLAPLCEFAHGDRPAFLPAVVGETGSRKTTICTLAMSHFGNFGSKQTTASFADTAASIVQKAFIVKDAPLLVDDYHPTTERKSQDKMKTIAQSLARAYGDLNGRGRANPDGTVQVSKPPRGLGMMSGEEAPDIGESGTARYYLIEIGKQDIPVSGALTKAQEQARQGALKGAMRGYLEWLIPLADSLPERLQKAFERLRSYAGTQLPDAHGRIVEATAWLLAALELMAEYFNSWGVALDTHAMEAAIFQNAKEQSANQTREKPVDMFMEALREMLATGAVYIEGYSENQFGERLGYIDHETSTLYLFAMQAYNRVALFFAQSGERFPLRRPELWKRLNTRGIKKTHNKETTQVIPLPLSRLQEGHEVVI